MSITRTAPLADPTPAASPGALRELPLQQALAQPTARRQAVELWHPWMTRFWPCTAREEAAFIAELRDRAAGPHGAATRDFDRRDVTALVTALRGGLSATELLGHARGLRPAHLVGAHAHLERARRAAADAWAAIVATPTSAALSRFGAAAATLLPAIVGHLDDIDRRAPRDLAAGIAVADAEISRTAHGVLVVEERLDACVAPSERGKAIGALLLDPRGDGAWSMATFLPPRVGTLVPLRVAALLGEDVPGRLRQAS